MLIQLGPRRTEPGLVEALTECHERIRRFTSYAARLAAAAPAPEPREVREVSAQVARYFRESLPLHLADEDEQVAPRLAGTSAEVDAALARMTAEHEAHEPVIARVIAICAELERDPARLAALAPELAAQAARLSELFAPHLELEERVIFPALARLPAGDRDAILAALRARRDRALSSPART